VAVGNGGELQIFGKGFHSATTFATVVLNASDEDARRISAYGDFVA